MYWNQFEDQWRQIAGYLKSRWAKRYGKAGAAKPRDASTTGFAPVAANAERSGGKDRKAP